MNLAVLGAGAWGTALAVTLSAAHRVTLWARDLEQFGACVRGPGAQKVRDDLGMARSQGLSVTPTFLIGRRQADAHD